MALRSLPVFRSPRSRAPRRPVGRALEIAKLPSPTCGRPKRQENSRIEGAIAGAAGVVCGSFGSRPCDLRCVYSVGRRSRSPVSGDVKFLII